LQGFDDYGVGESVYSNEYRQLTKKKSTHDWDNYMLWLRETHPEFYYNHYYGGISDEWDENDKLKPKPDYQNKKPMMFWGGKIVPNWIYNILGGE
jgi:hypothetical protein